MAFLCGSSSFLTLHALPSISVAGIVGCVALAAFLARRFHAAQLLVWACCGFLYVAAHTGYQLARVWPATADGERVRAEALIESVPQPRGEDWAFDAILHIEAPRVRHEEIRARIISRDPSVRPRAGDRWKLVLSLRPPRAPLNPGSVDFERLLFHDRIHALGNVVGSRLNQRLDEGHSPLQALRERIARRIDERVTDRDAAGLLAALAVGVTGGMSREQWRVFNATGTTHLVAISGLHVTLFAVVMFAVARRAWSLWLWKWRGNRESFAAVSGLVAATAYATLAGLSIPTQRTLVMLTAWWLARCMARTAPPLQPLAIALVLVLLIDPYAPLTAGFWLSFGAMAGILLATTTRFGRQGVLREAVAVQGIVGIVLVPFTLASFGSVSLVGPLVNVLAIPYMSWLLVPLVLLAVALIPVSGTASDAALALAERLHDLAWPWLAAAADHPVALAFASPPSWWYVLAGCAVPFICGPWPARLRLAVAFCALAPIVARPAAPSHGELEITILDVGEGTAIVLRTSKHVLVYGTGDSYGTRGGRIDSVLLPFLHHVGVGVVDRLVVPKLDAISSEGVTALLASSAVSIVSLGGTAPADFPGARPCGAEEVGEWEGIRLRLTDSCELDASLDRTHVRIGRGLVRISSSSGDEQLLVSGLTTTRSGSSKRALAAAIGHAPRIMATGESGAIRVRLARGAPWIEPQGERAARPALWRLRGPYPH